MTEETDDNNGDQLSDMSIEDLKEVANPDELKEELIRRAKLAGLKVSGNMGVAKLEDMIAAKALDDTPAKTTDENPEPEKQEAPSVEGTVRCRVTKKGDGKIHTGREDKPRYLWKDEIYLPSDVAESLEERAFVEIEE